LNLLRYLAAWLLLSASFASAGAEVRELRNPSTGLASWKAEDQGFSLELLQVSPDFVRAFYASRGMPPDLVDSIARHCVFGTVVRNESREPLSYRVADWRYVTAAGQEHPVKTKSDWLAQWGERGAPYGWSLLPDDQTFDPGDWNQGFTTVSVPHGSPFELLYSWSQDGRRHIGKIARLRCAPAEPQTP
jgi:hypothetical protein